MEQRREISSRCRGVAAEHLHWDSSSTSLLKACRGILATAQKDATN
jgi:hypothetical protein